MISTSKFQNKAFSAAVALTVGVGLAIGGSVGNYLVGIIIALPVGVAMYKHENKS